MGHHFGFEKSGEHVHICRMTIFDGLAVRMPGGKVKLPQGATPEGHLGGQDGKVWFLQMNPVRPASVTASKYTAGVGSATMFGFVACRPGIFLESGMNQ